MKLFRWVACGVLLHSAAVFAADDAGKFAMKGAGFLPCQVFVDEREKQSKTYYLVGGWIEGYVAAYNRYNAETFDILSFETLELLLKLMQNHCQDNPNDRLHSVLNSILMQVAADRLKKESARVEVGEGERKARLYRETIRRMQVELTRRGLYKGTIDGRFTAATQFAVMAFQSEMDLQNTGFPDQTTLWRLLRSAQKQIDKE